MIDAELMSQVLGICVPIMLSSCGFIICVELAVLGILKAIQLFKI